MFRGELPNTFDGRFQSPALMLAWVSRTNDVTLASAECVVGWMSLTKPGTYWG